MAVVQRWKNYEWNTQEIFYWLTYWDSKLKVGLWMGGKWSMRPLLVEILAEALAFSSFAPCCGPAYSIRGCRTILIISITQLWRLAPPEKSAVPPEIWHALTWSARKNWSFRPSVRIFYLAFLNLDPKLPALLRSDREHKIPPNIKHDRGSGIITGSSSASPSQPKICFTNARDYRAIPIWAPTAYNLPTDELWLPFMTGER